MTRSQRVALLIGLAIVAFMLLVPPWREPSSSRRGDTRGSEHAGYGVVFDPTHRLMLGRGKWVEGAGVQIDAGTLVVQCGLVAVMTAGAVVALGGRRSRPENG